MREKGEPGSEMQSRRGKKEREREREREVHFAWKGGDGCFVYFESDAPTAG